MIQARLELMRGADVLATRAALLRAQRAAGETARWREYIDTLRALAACVAVPETGDARGQLTTRQLSDRLGVSKRTIRRRRARGELAPVQVGGRGRTHRWAV